MSQSALGAPGKEKAKENVARYKARRLEQTGITIHHSHSLYEWNSTQAVFFEHVSHRISYGSKNIY